MQILSIFNFDKNNVNVLLRTRKRMKADKNVYFVIPPQQLPFVYESEG